MKNAAIEALQMNFPFEVLFDNTSPPIPKDSSIIFPSKIANRDLPSFWFLDLVDSTPVTMNGPTGGLQNILKDEKPVRQSPGNFAVPKKIQ